MKRIASFSLAVGLLIVSQGHSLFGQVRTKKVVPKKAVVEKVDEANAPEKKETPEPTPVPPPPPEPPKPFALKDDSLGMMLSEFRAKYYRPLAPGLASKYAPIEVPRDGGWTYCTQDAPYEWYNRLRPYPTVAGISVEPQFWFFPDGTSGEPRLTRIVIPIKQSDYLDLFIALKTKYNDPSSSSEDVLQNRLGASFTSRKHTWDNGVSRITLTERYGSIDKGMLEYQHNALMSIATGKLIEKAKGQAKDL